MSQAPGLANQPLRDPNGRTLSDGGEGGMTRVGAGGGGGLRIYHNDNHSGPVATRQPGSMTAARSTLQKRIPSPLQSFQIAQPLVVRDPPAQSPGLTAGTPTTPRYPSSSDLPRSPNRVKASSGKGQDPVFDAIKAAASRDALLEQAQAKARQEKQQKVEPPTKPTPTTMEPPASPKTAAVSSPTMISRQEPQPLTARSASLDSTISLTASPSQSFRSHSSEAPDAVDIPALIASAGSPEAAIRKLLQEKHSASSHNSQLWRLVEKQRSMIMGLNKDLERAMKDKERYRKKLKEHLISSTSLASLPGSAIRASMGTERDESQSPAISEAPEDLTGLTSRKATPESDTTIERSMTMTPTISQSATSPLATQNPMHATPMSAPFVAAPAIKSPMNTLGPALYRTDGLPQNRGLAGPTLPAVALSNSSEATLATQAEPPRTPKLDSEPSQKLTSSPGTQSSPQSFSSPKDRTIQALRKAPPARLDLSNESRDKPEDSVVDTSGSEYADDRSGGSAPIERGRRKTRIDDDIDREEQADQEPEPRSRSRKSHRSMERAIPLADDPSSPQRNLSISSGYSSPDEPGSPHIAQVQTYQSLNALNAVLKTPQDADFGPEIKRSLVPTILSPGLPLSPRPGDRPLNSPAPRAPKAPLNGIPMTPRTPGLLPLSPRAPRQPIPMPPQTPLSVSSPHLLRAEVYQQNMNDMLVEMPSLGSVAEFGGTSDTAFRPPRSPGDIYRGFVSEQYPGLLLPPNALPSILVKVDSSRLRPSRYSYMAPKQSEENPIFTLAIYARSDNAQLWRVEKTLHALAQFDYQLKSCSTFRTRLPERHLFTGHAPARIDARRSALGLYFDNLLDTPMDEQAATVVCSFFSSDAIGSEALEYFQSSHASTGQKAATPGLNSRPKKDGYLTKKGKNFGGWKARYFVCDGPSFKYYEAPGGALLGTIKLQNARITKQSQHPKDVAQDEEHQYRHALLIVEPKRKDSTSYVKHILCAESDDERDAWVDCLLAHIDLPEEGGRAGDYLQDKDTELGLKVPEQVVQPRSPRLQKSANSVKPPMMQTKDDLAGPQNSLRAVGYNDTVAAEAPVMMGPLDTRSIDTPSPPPNNVEELEESTSMSHPSISGPTNGARIHNSEAWGNKNTPAVLTKSQERTDRKRSIFAFIGRASSDTQTNNGVPQPGSDPPATFRPVFGVPLAEVCEYATPTDVPVQLPAVFYRCIEYLRAKQGASEEGIFRLSGSNIVIKGLKERFNTEGDVKLMAPDEQYYDIHAVAGLLKLYLRELPSSILTRDLHLDFLNALELHENTKIEQCNVLVNRLPRPNRELLEQMSLFLKEIVDNERVNKMSVRNVGIVFAPTLNIPAPLISLFVTDYATVFGPLIDISTSPSNRPQGPSQSFSTGTLPSEARRYPPKPNEFELPSATFNQGSLPNLNTYEAQKEAAKRAYDTGYTTLPQTQYQPPLRAQPKRFGPQSPGPQNFSHNNGGGNGTMSNSSSGHLNDVHISSSPFMGGESPEIPRQRGFDQPARLVRRTSAQLLMNLGMMDREKGRANGMPGTPGTPNANSGGRF